MAKSKINKNRPAKSKDRFSFGDAQIGAEIIRHFYQPTTATTDYAQPYDVERGMPIVAALMHVYPDMPLHTATGIVANSGVESYFNPAVAQGQNVDATGKIRGGGRGLFQWDGARRKKLLQMFPGDEWKKLENQLAFMAMENADTEARAWKATLAQPTAERAALTFSRLWERPGEPHNALRKTLARNLETEATSVGEDLFKQHFIPLEQFPGEMKAAWSGSPIARTMDMMTPEQRDEFMNRRISEQKRLADAVRTPIPMFTRTPIPRLDLAYDSNNNNKKSLQ